MMRRPRPPILLACLALFGLLAGCDDEAPDYRYRLTVEVDTPQGPRTGSSVIEVEQTLVRPGSNPAGLAVDRRIRGEAVAVDLPGGRTLFALLRSEESVGWAGYVMPMVAPRVPGEHFAEQLDDMLAVKGTVTLTRMWPPTGHLPKRPAYPMLVTFRDPADPTSIERVDPDDLAGTFGGGVSLRKITVGLTDDPVTSNLADRLKWFRAVANSGGGLVPMIRGENGRYEALPGYDATLAEIGLSSFSTQAYK